MSVVVWLSAIYSSSQVLVKTVRIRLELQDIRKSPMYTTFTYVDWRVSVQADKSASDCAHRFLFLPEYSKPWCAVVFRYRAICFTESQWRDVGRAMCRVSDPTMKARSSLVESTRYVSVLMAFAKG